MKHGDRVIISNDFPISYLRGAIGTVSEISIGTSDKHKGNMYCRVRFERVTESGIDGAYPLISLNVWNKFLRIVEDDLTHEESSH